MILKSLSLELSMTLLSLYSTLEQKLGLGLWRGLEDSEWLIWVGLGFTR